MRQLRWYWPVVSALIIIALVHKPVHAGTLTLNEPLPSAIVHQLGKAARDGLKSTHGPGSAMLQPIRDHFPGVATKSAVVYVGAEFCPYCAALRWPLTIALMRFGHFSGLYTMRSGARDVYPDTATVTFLHARYSSKWVDFIPTEVKDRDGRLLQPLKGPVAHVFHKFDAMPYSSRAGGLPFLYMGGSWLLIGTPVNPHAFANLTWHQIATQLANPNSALARAVIPQANMLTAAICETTGGQPSKVCKAPGVAHAAAVLSSS